MRITRALRLAFAGAPLVVPTADGQKVTAGPARTDGPPPPVPPPVPAAAAGPGPRTPGPAQTALRLEVQQLRLMKTPAGHRDLARRLRESEAARAALVRRVGELQHADESAEPAAGSGRVGRRLGIVADALTEVLAARLAAEFPGLPHEKVHAIAVLQVQDVRADGWRITAEAAALAPTERKGAGT